jgi:hypothetical protein
MSGVGPLLDGSLGLLEGEAMELPDPKSSLSEVVRVFEYGSALVCEFLGFLSMSQ